MVLATVVVAFAAVPADGNMGATEKASNSRAIRVPKTATTTSASERKAEPPVKKSQVLVLKVEEEKDRCLILDWKIGDGFDWKFLSVNNGEATVVPAHKSLVLKYSSYLRDLCETSSKRGIEKTSKFDSVHQYISIILIIIFYLENFQIYHSSYDELSGGNSQVSCEAFL